MQFQKSKWSGLKHISLVRNKQALAVDSNPKDDVASFHQLQEWQTNIVGFEQLAQNNT